MSEASGPPPDDHELAAFQRGELPLLRRAAVRAWLDRDAALRERLAGVARAESGAARGAARDRQGRLRWTAAVPVAAGFALIAIGFAAGRWLAPAADPPVQAAVAPPGGWRQAVAEYFSLDTAESLAAIADDAAVRQRELDAAARKLGLALPQAALTLPGLALKRTDVFAFHGMALAELLYLDPVHGPVALCIIANGRPDAPLRAEEREGLNLVFWQRRGLGFLIIGHGPAADLMQRAETAARRLAI
ncbi:MAG TPA: hypothetical protein VHD15_09555 [Hyphomicrobiales bacterium]|nr:hypothetical protein [Hyphomicrobiales bacterium]